VCSRLYYRGSCKDTFAQRRNRLTTHFSERIPAVKRRISVLAPPSVPPLLTYPSVTTLTSRGSRNVLSYKQWGDTSKYFHLSLTAGSASRPGRTLPPGKTRYPLYRRVGGPEGWSGQVRKIWPPPGFDLRTIQPVGSRYTDWAIPAAEVTKNRKYQCFYSPTDTHLIQII
jgi:hypothetical protein